MLFVGVLDAFFVDAEGRLDRLVLQGVSRRPLANDQPRQGTEPADIARFYATDGDSFVLRYSEAITLHIQYVKLTAE